MGNRLNPESGRQAVLGPNRPRPLPQGNPTRRDGHVHKLTYAASAQVDIQRLARCADQPGSATARRRFSQEVFRGRDIGRQYMGYNAPQKPCYV